MSKRGKIQNKVLDLIRAQLGVRLELRFEKTQSKNATFATFATFSTKGD